MKNKKEKKENNNSLLNYLLITFIIICTIFRYKNIYIDPNNVLEVSISNLLYPFTYLIIMFICNKSNFRNAHKTVIKTSIIFIIFMIVVSILNSIPANYYTSDIDTSLKEILTPDYFLINNHPIYYPNIINTLSFILLYYFSHTLILILYEAMIPYTKTFVAFSLSMFIPYALDTLCFTTLSSIHKEVELHKLITNLTSNFVLVIIFTIIITIIYTIKSKIKEEQTS